MPQKVVRIGPQHPESGRLFVALWLHRDGRMRPEDLRIRTKQFALAVIELWRRLPQSDEYQEIGGQLRRAANAVAANYRAARCGRSHAEFTAKLGTVHEEADECQHHLEMLAAIGLEDESLDWLQRESSELVAIFTTSLKTAKRRREKKDLDRKSVQGTNG